MKYIHSCNLRTKIILGTFTAVLALTLGLIFGFTFGSSPRKISILPLGDSITFGSGPDPIGYRIPMLVALNQYTRYQSIGPRKDGPDYVPDWMKHHAGYRGWTISMVDERAFPEINTLKPDIITLHIGTNDCGQQLPTATVMEARIQKLLEHIFVCFPATHLFLASTILPGAQFPDWVACIRQFNYRLPGIVAEFNTSGFKIHYVPMAEENPTLELCTDGIHPSASGNLQMAASFSLAIANSYET